MGDYQPLNRRVNCTTCRHGKDYWWWKDGKWRCPNCEGDPLADPPNGRPDWKEFSRAKFIRHFGYRMGGDREILEKYREELIKAGW